jgi:hypothetical protein
MYVIGIDPHKGSHTAAVLDGDEELLGELRAEAGRGQRDQLLAFAARFRAAHVGDRGSDRLGGALLAL